MDGYPDLVVGTPDTFNGRGRAWVFSGRDGSVAHMFTGSKNSMFGFAVDGAGDVDSDGFDDVIVGAPMDRLKGVLHRVGSRGSATVYSGSDGSPLLVFAGDGKYDFFGFSVAGAGDIDQDGHADLIVGTDSNGQGYARVFLGADGTPLHTIGGDWPDGIGYIGTTVSRAGDVNRDDIPDLIIGEGFDDQSGSESGRARVFSAGN